MDFYKTIILNYVMSWITVLLMLILSAKYLFRKLATKYIKTKPIANIMKKTHILMGILYVIFGLIHGIYSSEKIISLNLGTILWVIGILMGVNYYARKRISGKRISWLRIHQILTVTSIVLLIWHVVDVGGIHIFEAFKHTDVTLSSKETDTLIEKVNENNFGATLKDGTYSGIADGYGKNLTVEVEVKDNKVTRIDIVSHNERNARFYALPIQVIPEEIIKSQSLEVDMISGATYTSVGIINAIYDALSKAAK